jgi:hypothetical protein
MRRLRRLLYLVVVFSDALRDGWAEFWAIGQ